MTPSRGSATPEPPKPSEDWFNNFNFGIQQKLSAYVSMQDIQTIVIDALKAYGPPPSATPEGKPTASEEYWRKRLETAEGLLYSWLRADCRRLNPNLALSTEVFLSQPPALSPEAEAAVAAISPAFLTGPLSPTEPAATPTEKGGTR